MSPQAAVTLLVGGHISSIGGEPVVLDAPRMFTAAHPPNNLARPAVQLLVGGQCGQVQGERYSIGGDVPHMFTAAHLPSKTGKPVLPVLAALDSGAFTDPPHKRLTPDRALERQLAWEQAASTRWGHHWQAMALVSYDLLIDETWIAGERHKRRWSVSTADRAVGETVDAARYLAGQRAQLAPRTLILSAQGVDAIQYDACAQAVLDVARPGDWFGLGGWCILGRQQSLLPVFWQTLYRVLPRVTAAGLSHVHIFGVLWEPALAGLVWMADQHGLNVSTDSTAPVLACTWKDAKKSGRRRDHWRDNVAWWVEKCAGLRTSPYYRKPPRVDAARQLGLFDQAAALAAGGTTAERPGWREGAV